jgi:hypothetical protein
MQRARYLKDAWNPGFGAESPSDQEGRANKMTVNEIGGDGSNKFPEASHHARNLARPSGGEIGCGNVYLRSALAPPLRDPPVQVGEGDMNLHAHAN